MQKKSNSKTIIALIVILVIAAGVYFYLNGAPTDSDTLLTEESGLTNDANAAGARVLTLLNQISSLKIDTALFQSSVYASLVDHTVPIYEQNVGKENPFYRAPGRTATAPATPVR